MASLEEALYAKLTGDTTLMALVTGVYNTVAIPEAVYPFLLFQMLMAPDEYTIGKRVCVNYRYQIKCVAQGYDNEPCVAAMSRVDALLTDQSLTVAGYTLWKMRRFRQIPSYAEPDVGGRVYQHVGAEWDIVLSPT